MERLHQAPPASTPEPLTPSRWTLQRIGAACDWLAGYSLSGVWRVLQSADIRLRSGRVQAYSPDPDYEAKVARLLQVLHEAAVAPGQIEVVFVDQMGYGRWPEAAADWSESAPAPRPVAQRRGSNERKWRLIGALNASSGQVTAQDNYIVGRKQVIGFLRLLDATYPAAQRLYVVLDNWSIHRHEEVLAALKTLPRLELIWLPTYAPWLNPIEKLWRWMRQDMLYLHQQADDWPALQARVHGFLAQFAAGSQDLLQYVGLLGDGLLAQARKGL